MAANISIGNQSFDYMRENKSFYVDKSALIREWWETDDAVTLITRPRRFGKTLNISMLECFFSTKYAGRSDLFEGLSVWEDEKYRGLQGMYPVICVSFAGIKADNFQGAKNGIIHALANAYDAHRYVKDSDILGPEEKKMYDALHVYALDPSPDKKIDDQSVTTALQTLSSYLERYHSKKAIIFLDEYDTPLQEAYAAGYWRELVRFIRELFNFTFKDNKKLHRALLTGITRVSKESVFSDLNNLLVVTTTSKEYSTAFGFTEKEVFAALEEKGLSDQREGVKAWYDGFNFGDAADIYNPWSITMYLRRKEYRPYWADTSSNILISELVREGTPEIKMQMEKLLAGECLETELDEQVIFEQLKKKKGAIWSLLVACGYLKPVERIFSEKRSKFIYKLMLTNHEVALMFREMVAAWFPEDEVSYGNFKEALITGDLDYMNQYMNEISEKMFSSFDVGRKPSEQAQPERFYHGFVLGLIVDLEGRYRIRSNRESGLGRYDVMLEPLNSTDDAIVIEFKVFSPQKDRTMGQAVQNALKQIEEKRYDTELNSRGISGERIRHYGFVFEGKKVLIGQGDGE
ncbi:MAG TPA: hypothetical protein DF613_14235 [Lachnospiraceae bacterium]|nr:hypothetical protein [Lachnospiraceae bacterium]